MFGYHECHWLMPISMALFWGTIIYMIFSNNDSTTKTVSAADIAKKRYANGEISVEELNEIKKNL